MVTTIIQLMSVVRGAYYTGDMFEDLKRHDNYYLVLHTQASVPQYGSLQQKTPRGTVPNYSVAKLTLEVCTFRSTQKPGELDWAAHGTYRRTKQRLLLAGNVHTQQI